MAGNGATLNFDIERANSDEGYWGQVTSGDFAGAGSTPGDTATTNVGTDVTGLITGGQLPYGFVDGEPRYVGGGRQPYSESFQTEPVAVQEPGLGRFATFNSDGTVRGPGQLARPRRSADDSQTHSNQEVARANARSSNSGNFTPPREEPRERYVPASDQGVWQEFYKDVQGRHNLLHDFNSYNYNLTLVSLSKDQVEDPEKYKGKIITDGGVESKQFYIVARSGGFSRTGNNPAFIGPSPQGAQQQYKESRSNKDLFIENCTFDTRVGINNMGQSNLTTGTFEVTEPHGVGGFYRELFASSKFSGHPNYIDSPFLLVVSFIGRVADRDLAVIPDKTTRYLPIRITNSEMSVNEGGARYTVSFMAYNSVGASDAVSVLWDNTEPRGRSDETVESLLYSTFLFNTIRAEEIAIEHQRELENDEEKTQAVEARLQSNETANRTRSAGLSSAQVGAFMPHKYLVWFADGWSGSFPKNAQKLSEESSSWTTNARQFLDLGNAGGLPGSGLPYSNDFAEATMSPAVLPNPIMVMPNLNEQLEEQNKVIDEQEDAINATKDQIRAELETFNAARDALIAQTEATPGNPRDNQEPSLSRDLTVRTATRAEDIVSTVETQTQEATNLANRIISASGDSVDQRIPVQTELPITEVTSVVEIRRRIEQSQQRINTLSDTLAQQEVALENLQRERTNTPRRRQPIGDGNPFGFRKGSSLLDVIDIVITNSSAMQDLVNESTLNSIAQSEQIPWYKVDILATIIGFDVITMNYQYEYHYVISPYQVHYSKMPGVNIIFDTATLKRRAIREYNYIYTGKNLDVLSFDIKYNNLFRYPLLLSPPSENALQSAQRTEVTNTRMDESNYQETISRVENRLNNKLGETGFTMANAIEPMDYLENPVDNGTHIGKALKDFLYAAPTDQGLIRAQVEIVGDPVYIIGSGITDRPNVSVEDITTPDGEMNSFSREPDVVFKFRFPEDIPTATELANGTSQQALKDGEYSGLYQVLGVENRFVDGTFTQGLQLLRRRNQRQDFEVNDEGESLESAQRPEE